MKITMLFIFILFLFGCSNFHFDHAASFGWSDAQEQNVQTIEIKKEEKKLEGVI